MEIPPEQEINFYNTTFLTSMRINDKSKDKALEIYWNDYPFFVEIYTNFSYIWNKQNIYKDFDIEA